MFLKYAFILFPYVALLLSMIIWGGVPTMIKLALTQIDVSSFIVLRFMISSILLLPVLGSITRKIKLISLPTWLAFAVTVAVMFYSQTWAIGAVSVSWYVVLFSITPALIAVFLRYKMSWKTILCVGLLGVSLFLFISTDRSDAQWSWLGLGAVFIGILSWVIYSVLIKKLHVAFNDVQITALTCYIAAIVNIGIWVMQGAHSLLNLSFNAYKLSALTGILLPLAFFCYSFAMRRVPRFAIFGQYFEPVFGLVIAVIVLGRSLSILQYGLSGLILLEVALVTKTISNSPHE